MPLRDTLQTILTDYAEARSKPFADHSLADFIRHGAAEQVKDALGELGAGLLVEGSAGAGNWATVPWISVFDPAITTSATRGYYVVYLFHASEPVVHLSLNRVAWALNRRDGASGGNPSEEAAETHWQQHSGSEKPDDGDRAYRIVPSGGARSDGAGEWSLARRVGLHTLHGSAPIAVFPHQCRTPPKCKRRAIAPD